MHGATDRLDKLCNIAADQNKVLPQQCEHRYGDAPLGSVTLVSAAISVVLQATIYAM